MQFLVIFLVVPLILLVLVGRRSIDRTFVLVTACVCVVAVLYTGPWDNLIIANGVWSYHHSQVLGRLIGRVPLEEYGFYILQVSFAGLVTLLLLTRRAG